MLFLKNIRNNFFSFFSTNIFLLTIISRAFFIIHLICMFYIAIRKIFLYRLKNYTFFRKSFFFFFIFYITGIFINLYLNNSLENQVKFFLLIFLFFFIFFFGYYLYTNQTVYISFSRLVLYFNILIIIDIFLYRLFHISLFPVIADIHETFGQERYAGVFLTKKVLGGYLCISFPIIYNYLNLRLRNFDLFFTKYPFFYSLIYFISIVLTGDRRPSLIFGVILFFYYVFNKKNKFNVNNIIIIFVILFSLLFISYLNEHLFSRFTHGIFSIVSNINDISYVKSGNWFQLYHSSFQIILNSLQNFIIGIGSKNFTVNCHANILNTIEGCSTHPHNLYIEMFLSFGLIGFLIFFISIFKIFSFLIKLLFLLKLKDRYKILNSIFIQINFFFPFLPSGGLFAADLLIYYCILNSIIVMNLLTISNNYDFKKI